MTVPHPLMQQLTAARQQAGLTLDEWASRLGIRPSTVSYLERGISSPSLAALERLAGDLGYEVVLRKAPAQPTVHTGGNAEDCPACAPGIDKTVLYPWICPGNGPGSPAQPTTPATGDTETTPDATGGADDLSALRDRIAEALTAEHYRRAHEQVVASPEEHQAACADAAMDVIRPELEHHREVSDAALKGWKAEKERAQRAEMAGAEMAASRAELSAAKAGHAALRALLTEALVHRKADGRRRRGEWQGWERRVRAALDIALGQQPSVAQQCGCADTERTYAELETAYQQACQRAEQAERDRDTLKRDIIDASEQNHQFKGEIDRLTTLLAQYADRGIANGQRADRYRTAWWSARIRAAKSHAAYVGFHDLLEEANATIAQIRKLHSRHECDDCNCRLCWGLLPVCSAGCAEYPCPTVRALDAVPEQTETGQHAACDGCETCELAAELADARAAIDRVRRLCELTINASCRVQAIEQARDTLAALDRTEPDATGSAQ